MTNKLRSTPVTLADQPGRKQPVQVKLKSADAYSRPAIYFFRIASRRFISATLLGLDFVTPPAN